jgi:DNA-binding transcriptional LysR family regulator
MTLEQLRVFVAVAERLHMTRAAEALHITQSGASAAVAALEARYGAKLFDRVGRGLALTEAGRVFLPEARSVLARAAAAEQALDDLAGLKRGSVALYASQTIASYWLPPRLVRLRRTWPQIAVALSVGNTAQVARAVREGEVELGLIEGVVDEPLLTHTRVGADRLVVVTSAERPWPAPARVTADDLATAPWVMREAGSGTRSMFEDALRSRSVDPARREILMELPSNEAVLTAVTTGGVLAAVSELAAGPMLHAGMLAQVPFELPPRTFELLQHRDRQPSRAAQALVEMLE